MDVAQEGIWRLSQGGAAVEALFDVLAGLSLK